MVLVPGRNVLPRDGEAVLIEAAFPPADADRTPRKTCHNPFSEWTL